MKVTHGLSALPAKNGIERVAVDRLLSKPLRLARFHEDIGRESVRKQRLDREVCEQLPHVDELITPEI